MILRVIDLDGSVGWERVMMSSLFIFHPSGRMLWVLDGMAREGDFPFTPLRKFADSLLGLHTPRLTLR